MCGIESADDQILRNMHKNASVDRYRRGIALLKQADIHVHAGFIVGFPGETEQTARKMVPFIDELGIDFTTINPWIYLPSTPIARRAAEFGLQGSAINWRHETMNSAEAHILAREAAQQQKYAIHNSARGRPWLEFLMYANGLSLDETRTVIGTYNRMIGRSVTRADITDGPDCADLRAVLRRHDLPRPEIA
jgi:p-methyltransferase